MEEKAPRVPFELDIECPGIVLVNIWNDIFAQDGDSSGLLIGTWDTRRVNSVDDNSQTNEVDKTLITITASQCAWDHLPLFSATGKLDESAFQEYSSMALQGLDNQIVLGWYRFRRGMPLRPTMREIRVHSALCALLSRSGAPRPSPLFLLLSTKEPALDSVHLDPGSREAGRLPGPLSLADLEHRIMQISARAGLVRARTLRVSNLEQGAERAYSAFSGAACAARGGPGAPLSVEAALGDRGVREAREPMEGAVRDVLSDVDGALRDLVRNEDEIDALRAEIEALRARSP